MRGPFGNPTAGTTGAGSDAHTEFSSEPAIPSTRKEKEALNRRDASLGVQEIELRHRLEFAHDAAPVPLGVARIAHHANRMEDHTPRSCFCQSLVHNILPGDTAAGLKTFHNGYGSLMGWLKGFSNSTVSLEETTFGTVGGGRTGSDVRSAIDRLMLSA